MGLGSGSCPQLVARDGVGVALRRPAVFWLFAASILAVRLLPVPVRRRHREDRDLAAASGAFALALAVGALAAGLVQRATRLRTAFALGRGTLALAAADGLYRLLGGGPQLATADLPAWALAAAAFLVVDALAEAGLAVAAGRHPAAFAAPGHDDGGGAPAPRRRIAALTRRWRRLHGAGPPAWAPLALLVATPAMLAAARHASLLVLLLLAPTAALWLACRDAAVAERRRAAAAAALVASRAAAAEQD